MQEAIGKIQEGFVSSKYIGFSKSFYILCDGLNEFSAILSKECRTQKKERIIGAVQW